MLVGPDLSTPCPAAATASATTRTGDEEGRCGSRCPWSRPHRGTAPGTGLTYHVRRSGSVIVGVGVELRALRYFAGRQPAGRPARTRPGRAAAGPVPTTGAADRGRSPGARSGPGDPRRRRPGPFRGHRAPVHRRCASARPRVSPAAWSAGSRRRARATRRSRRSWSTCPSPHGSTRSAAVTSTWRWCGARSRRPASGSSRRGRTRCALSGRCTIRPRSVPRSPCPTWPATCCGSRPASATRRCTTR